VDFDFGIFLTDELPSPSSPSAPA
jgi:hypothetical protein